MAKTDQLQELILSMSRNEKGYFKKYCKMYSSQKDQKYLKLYEVMEKEKVYDEQVLLEHLRGEIEAKILPAQKNYLYNLILKVLEHFYSNKYPDLEISNAINQAKVLYYKGLFEHAKKVLRKAKKQAEKHEFLYLVGEIIELEQKLFNTSAKAKTSYEENRQFFEGELQNLGKLKNLVRCRDLERRMVDQHWAQGLNVAEDINLDELLEVLQISKDEMETSITAQLHYNHALLLYYYVIKGDLPEAFQYAEANFNLIKTYPKVSKQDERKYIRVLYVYLGFCMPLKKEIAFLKGMELLENFKSKDLHTQADIFDLKSNLSFNYVLLLGRFEHSEKYITAFQKQLPKYREYLSTRSLTVFYHLVAFIHHLNQEHHQALTAINQVFLLEEEDTRIDIQAVARIQDILLHFDLENWSLVASKTRNCLRFLKKHKHLYPINEMLLRAIKSVATNPNTGYQAVFKSLNDKIEKHYLEETTELKFLEHFDFICWVKSKLDGEAFKTVYLRKRILS